MLVLNSITKKFGDVTIFKDFSLNIEEGEFIGIVGQSGSGKTTLLKIIGMLDMDYSGEYFLKKEDRIISFKDKRVLRKRNKIFSYVFQENNLFSYLTVKENVKMPLIYSKRKVDENELDKVLIDLGIDHLKDRKVNNLSGGEKQRVAIARCILMKTPFILADEPTGSLDFKRNFDIINIFKKIAKTYKVTVIVVTHNLDILKEFDRVVEIGNE